MNNTMTQLKDVLHFYLGQQFVLRINNVLSPDNGKLSGQMYFGIEAYTVSTNPKDPRDKIEPLLVLRKLSSMTEEEAVNMYNHCYPNSTAPKEVRADIIKSLLTKKGLYNEGQESFFDYIEWFPYLLSKGFDLFQLIENNLAIDSDTLKS